MKAYLLLIFLGVVYAGVDYTSLATWSGTAACTASDPWQQTIYSFQSPVYLENSICFPYGLFSLSMADIDAETLSADATIGAMTVAYTGTTLTLDNRVYTSTAVAFRAKAEHRLYTDDLLELEKSGTDDNQSDIEMQILMKTASGENAVFSILFKSYDNTKKYQTPIYKDLNILTAITTTTATIKLDTFAKLINSKIDSGLFLNIHRYNGTLTYPPCANAVWFIYGTHLYVDAAVIAALQTAMRANAATIGPLNTTISAVHQNSRPFTPATANAQGAGGGAQYAVRMCFTGYFDIYLNWNFCLWFCVVIVTCFFILTLSIGESPITDPDYVEEVKTIHPLVSLWKVGNEYHTRKSRASLILTMMTVNALFASTFYNVSGDRERPSNIIVYAIYSMLISQAITFFHGCILRHYYVAKRHYMQTKDEKWNQKAQNRLFAFYTLLFVFTITLWPVAVYNNDRFDGKHQLTASNYWVATFFVCLGLEWLFMDVIKCLLAWKITFFRNLFKWNGYFYDNLCHQTYMDLIKMD